MHRIQLNVAHVKPVALATMYACYVIGYDWRVANGLAVSA